MFRCRALLFLIAACALSSAQIINPGGGGATGTVSPNNGTAGCLANYAAAGGSTTIGPDSAICDSSGNLVLSGNVTMNNATPSITVTAPSTDLTITTSGAGVVVPAGTATAPGLKFSGDLAGAGLYRSGSVNYSFTNGTTPFASFITGGMFRTANGGSYGMSSTSSSTGGYDICWHRSAPGVAQFDTDGACSNGQAKLKAAGYISTGTTFTGNAGCSETTLVGGATAGKFTAVSTSCTVVLTLGNTATAPTGWSCWAHDLTTAADYNNPRISASTATTVTIITGTIVSSDVIEFGCVGY